MTDLKVNPGDPLSARNWNTLVDQLPSPSFGTGGGLGLASAVSVPILNNTGQAIEFGDLVHLAGMNGPKSDRARAVANNFEIIAESPVWATKLDRIAVVQQDAPDAQRSLAIVSGLAVAKLESVTSLAYTMVDPDLPTQLKPSNGGIARLIAALTTSGPQAYGIVQLGDAQHLWRAELKDDNGTSTSRSAKLLNLDGEEFGGDVAVFDPELDWEDLETGDRAWVVFSGRGFWALQTAGSIDCATICEKCGVFANEDGTCGDAASTIGCCDFDEITPGDRCNYQGNAIGNLLLEDSSGNIWTQNGDSSFAVDGVYCQWNVPVLDDIGDQVEATVERRADGWYASISGIGWSVTTGPTSCSGSETALSDGNTGTGSFDYTENGTCPEPPITVCDEELTGTIYPRARVIGYPDTWNEFRGAGGVGDGEPCIGIAFDNIENQLTGANGTFLGPPLVENPGGPSLPPVWPDPPALCSEIQFISTLKQGANAVCTENDLSCAEKSDENHNWGSGSTLQHGGLIGPAFLGFGLSQFTGDCSFGGNDAAVFPTPTCDAGSTWRDIQLEYRMQFRRILNGPLLQFQCFTVDVIIDYVEQ